MCMSSSLSVVSSSSISSFPVGGHATKRIQNFGRSGMKERFFFQRVRLAVSGRPSIRARLSVQSLRTKVSNTAMRSKILSSSLPAFDCAGAGPLHLVRIFMPTSNVTFSFFFSFPRRRSAFRSILARNLVRPTGGALAAQDLDFVSKETLSHHRDKSKEGRPRANKVPHKVSGVATTCRSPTDASISFDLQSGHPMPGPRLAKVPSYCCTILLVAKFSHPFNAFPLSLSFVSSVQTYST